MKKRKNIAKWKQEYLDKIFTMGNDDFFYEYEYCHSPDDWGWCFTKSGEFKADATREELLRRLKITGFLSEEII